MCLVPFTLTAQKQSYAKDYFMFPIMPGQPNSLAGVLGDLRTNHYHGGLDIRTQQREGLSVHAAAEGYVYRVAVQGTGYGNVIYLRHPNGLTTVYGHLQKFGEKLADYVREQQYQKQSFTIDLYPEPGQITFKKGEVMALSGNTGGSGGPHLHFEIRDSQNNYLNPLFFGFKEIRDNTSPAFLNLALRPMKIDSRVNGRFDRQTYKPIRQSNGTYRIPQTIRATGEIGLELQAYDFMSGTGFRYGLHCIEVKVDGREIFAYNMEKFPSLSTRDYNNLIDYRTEQETGARFYKLYHPDGNLFEIFKTDSYRGKLQIRDTLTHEVSIKIFDSFENWSQLSFTIRGESAAEETPAATTEAAPVAIVTDAQENILKVTAQGYRSPEPFANFYSDRRRVQEEPAYYINGAAVFLTDLRKYLPDSVQVGDKEVPVSYKASILPGQPVTYTSDRWTIKFDTTSLFDTLHLAIRQSHNTLTINEPEIPLRYYIGVTYRPDGPETNQERTQVYRYHKGGYSYVGGTWQGDRVTFQTRELGTFILQTDLTPPNVRLVEHSKNRIRAFIGDSMSGIDSFRAQVNGEWVLMNYEYKSRYIWSEKLDESKPFEGELVLEVKDKAGNSTILRTNIAEPVVKKASTRKRR
ncbi:M23 family metallopeptidase [Telluribacter sp.]|uniref:M23 family metallopeptidase n=1 Tax=Telluribacter sp. TaxID=1978767 RepID=UPI002E0EC21E|nr:M23 family metallopeptidase [Telluribacter sp.]